MRLLFVLISLCAEPSRAVLLQEEIGLPAMRQQTVLELPAREEPATLVVEFKTLHDGEGVAVSIHSGGKQIADSGYRMEGLVRLPLAPRTNHEVRLENRRQRLGSVAVRVKASLITEARPPGRISRLADPARSRAAIATSLSLFGGIVAYAAWTLGPALRRRFLDRAS